MTASLRKAVFLGLIFFWGCAIAEVAPVPKSGEKVAICHKGKTIHVDEAAVKAHLKHGDYIGPCK